MYRPAFRPLTDMFIQEFITLLESLAAYNGLVVITGDLTVHMDDIDCLWAE